MARSTAKAFALRGFKGKGFLKLDGAERLERMKAAARKERVVAGAEGTSNQLRTFMREEGIGMSSSTHPTLPWNSRSGKRTKKVALPTARPFHLAAAVARFKRTGDLPSVPVKDVKAANADGVDGRVLKRMISAMLLKSGLETNPGPPKRDMLGEPECCYSGMRIKGDRVRLRNRLILVCTKCPANLQEVVGQTGLHPGTYVEDQAFEQASDQEVDPPSFVDLSKEMLSSSLVPPPQAAAPSNGSAPVPPPVPPLGDVGGLTPAAVRQRASVEHPLAGHTISACDCVMIMSRLIGREIMYDQIRIESIVVPYVGEQRLATNRNVQELKQSFCACQLTVCETPSIAWRHYVLAATILFSVLEASLCFYFGHPMFMLVGAIIIFVALMRYFTAYSPFPRTYSVCYVPHLVSSVMAEYNRGTNAIAARATLRQKMRQLASLPLPDKDALKLIAGSELVCEQLLTHEDFFWEGAACFRQPL